MAEYIEGTFGPAWKKTLGGNLRPVEPAEFAELDKGTQLFDSQGRSLGFIKEATGDSVTITSVRGDEAEGHTAELMALYLGGEKPEGEVPAWGAKNLDYPPRATDVETTKPDMVNHPPHYAEGREHEPKDVIRDWGLNYNLGSAVKYISRAGRKENMIQDIDKAIAYLGFEREAILAEREES